MPTTKATTKRGGTEPGRKVGLAHRLYTGEVSYDFVGHRKGWYIVSVVLMTVSVAAMTILGLDWGIEFRGGSDYQVATRVTDDTVGRYRQAVNDTGLANLSPVVTTIGTDRVRVQVRSLTVEEQQTVRAAIAQEAGVPADQVAYQLIGASWGRQITQQAVIALVVFLVLVALLIWLYFRDLKMAFAALVALGHDLVLTVGVYAVVQFTVTPATMIGVLTILGYSLYDTVVVFDKVRENVAEIDEKRITYSEAANLAVNQVLIRSLNTTIIGVLPVAALLFAGVVVLGSGPLMDLGLALFVGMVAGAYSSIFIATPLLAQLKEREPAMVEHRRRLERRSRRAEAKEAAQSRRAATVPLTVTPVAASTSDEAAADAPSDEAADQPAPTRHQPTRTSRRDRK